jgi:hypothetical protein
VLAYNLANFRRTLALPKEVAEWSLTRLREKVVTIGAQVVAHGRSLGFQMTEVAVPRALFRPSSIGSPGSAHLPWRDVAPSRPPPSSVAGPTCGRRRPDDRHPEAGATVARRV